MHNENREIIRQLNACTDECNHCYNACLNEKDVTILARCIELDRECADICQWTASFLARDSEHVNELMHLCSEICLDCADECDKHEHEHCKRCAAVCRQCAEGCNSHQTAS